LPNDVCPVACPTNAIATVIFQADPCRTLVGRCPRQRGGSKAASTYVYTRAQASRAHEARTAEARGRKRTRSRDDRAKKTRKKDKKGKKKRKSKDTATRGCMRPFGSTSETVGHVGLRNELELRLLVVCVTVCV
jgi:hypothetical protein